MEENEYYITIKVRTKFKQDKNETLHDIKHILDNLDDYIIMEAKIE